MLLFRTFLVSDLTRNLRGLSQEKEVTIQWILFCLSTYMQKYFIEIFSFVEPKSSEGGGASCCNQIFLTRTSGSSWLSNCRKYNKYRGQIGLEKKISVISDFQSYQPKTFTFVVLACVPIAPSVDFRDCKNVYFDCPQKGINFFVL